MCRVDLPIESVATPKRAPSLRITNAEYFARRSFIVVARLSSRACHFEKVDRCSNLNCRDVSVITRVLISESLLLARARAYVHEPQTF
jgi:hypothetical protein